MIKTAGIYAIALSLLLGACVNFRTAAQSAITHTYAVNKNLFREAQQYLGAKVQQAARECHKAGDRDCKKGRELIAVFKKVAKLSSYIDMSLIVAQKAIIDSDVSGYNKIMAEIVKNLGLIRELMERI